MKNELFIQLASVISSRRTVKPQAMNGRLVENELISEILQLADYAPNHGLTEPWRFVVFGPGKIRRFCFDHAELYLRHTAAERYDQAKYDKLYHMGDKASHVAIAIMKRGDLPKNSILGRGGRHCHGHPKYPPGSYRPRH